eukprot:TRINITY_DN70632_c0_g1_i1.p1 TRINITY_DN70632_c0_g1~~TRINITY_DN70632_c0_g1_i1.p1  ORF type:complete len:529 (-),score=46.11 TRINITY_DN70632_c0_g1_i1:939-2525(-)
MYTRAFTVATLTWTIIIVALKLLDFHLAGAVAQALYSRRITLRLFWLRYQTACIPRCVRAFARRRARVLRLFYATGVVVTAFAVPLVCALLLTNVGVMLGATRARHEGMGIMLNGVMNGSTRSAVEHIVRSRRTLLQIAPRSKPIEASVMKLSFLSQMPSLTFRQSDALLVFVALLASVLIHELGHLLCALLYQAHVTTMGLFVAFLFPGAFVTLNNLHQHPICHQLQIVCAGIWHNLITVLITRFIIAIVPVLSLAFYTRPGSLIITSLPANSPLSPSVSVGDIITTVADTEITHGQSSFESALFRLHSQSNAPGFCIPQRWLRPPKNGACCRSAQWSAFHPSRTTRCFTTQSREVCLDAVHVALQPMCNTTQDCKPRMRCARPKLQAHHRLIVLSVKRKEHGLVRVLYDGTVPQLWRAVQVSEYVPRGWQWMNAWFMRLLVMFDVPPMIIRMLWFVAAFCLVLAASNMAPALFLDGQLFIGLVILMVGIRLRWKQRLIKRIETWIVYSATLIVITNVLLSVHFMTR